ncbi:MAG: FtsW/RodA/SpoVE family cell cycle protein, partial [Proteobacteria bacterium]|nr:FtsW/RodA/SpoVE family cell cycle protein [Pseudomonadota bacterium]
RRRRRRGADGRRFGQASHRSPGAGPRVFVQTVINIGMTIGLTPITGMSLPFVSSGGSGLVTNYLAIGLLISVARRRTLDIAPRPFEIGEESEA